MNNIVKVQRAITSNCGNPVLVYNEDKSIMTQFAEPKWLKKQMGADPLKAFFFFHLEKGKVDGKEGNYIVLDGRAPYQNW
ncbi:MAG: hypothetical protein PHE32_04085 [Candidatus Shapirobacteria bacterium]|nr:hypothetical protein [Candidatus Shapirobacteria bacterium]